MFIVGVALLSGCGTETKVIHETSELTASTQTEVVEETVIDSTRSETISCTQELYPNIITYDEIDPQRSQTGTVVLEDAEDTLVAGWSIFDNTPEVATIVNTYTTIGNVITLNGSCLKNGFMLRDENDDVFNNTNARELQWRGQFASDFIIFVSLLMEDNSIVYLSYSASQNSEMEDVYQILLPEYAKDGNWHTFMRNLTYDMGTFLPNLEIKSVLDFQVRGSGSLDDIKLIFNENQTDNEVIEDLSAIKLEYNLSLNLDYALEATNIDANITSLIENSLQNVLGSLINGSVISDTTTTFSNEDISSILATARQLQTLSNTLLALSNSADGQNQAYLDAMLRLSDDIGLMADRIGEMADRILTMGEMVQVMGYEILSTIETTQTNLLTAQNNFNLMLQTLLEGTTQITDTLSTQLQTMITLLLQIQGGDDSLSSTATDMMMQLMATFTQMQGDDTTATVENMSLMLQMITMMQDMAMSGSNTMIEMMSQGMSGMMSMMQQMLTAMSDPNSGMSPAAVALEMIAAAERLADKSLDILNASLQNPDASEAMLEAMQISATFMNDMADKMLVMADKMVAMGVMAQDVAFRVLELMETTESNLLQAQLNFNDLIFGVIGQN